MSKQIHFFTTKSDLLTKLAKIESQISIKYFHYNAPRFFRPVFLDSLLTYKKLGINTTGSHVTGDMFIILDKECLTNTSFFGSGINQITYPDSITFQPGGLYKGNNLICGHATTASTSKKSLELYKQFTQTLIQDFKKVQDYYVGEEAYEMLLNGYRLITIGIDSPKEYDLKLEGPK